MEKYCSSCSRVFKDSDFKFCPYCAKPLKTRVGRQSIPRKLRHLVFERDRYRCRECGATNKQTQLHVDHIKPVSKGGTNDLDNLQTLCEKCNMAKYTDEWIGGKSDNRNRTKKTVGNGIYWTPEEITRYKSLDKKLKAEGNLVSPSDFLDPPE